MRTKALLNRSGFNFKTHAVFIIHLPVHVAHSTFVGFQGDPWISCHIDELRSSGENAITPEVAQRVTVSQLFYGHLETTLLERQISELSSDVGVTFDRLTSVEEEDMEEGEGWEKKITREQGHQGEGESNLEIRDMQGESEGDDANETNSFAGVAKNTMVTSGNDEKEKDSVGSSPTSSEIQPQSHVSVTHKTLTDVYTQCVRLNSCIQAAASRLQESTRNKQRATERVRLLIQVIPAKPAFPLGKGTLYQLSL